MSDRDFMNERHGHGWEERIINESANIEIMYKRLLKKGIMPDRDNGDRLVPIKDFADSTLTEYIEMLTPDAHTEDLEKKAYNKLVREATRRGLGLPNLEPEANPS